MPSDRNSTENPEHKSLRTDLFKGGLKYQLRLVRTLDGRQWMTEGLINRYGSKGCMRQVFDVPRPYAHALTVYRQVVQKLLSNGYMLDHPAAARRKNRPFADAAQHFTIAKPTAGRRQGSARTLAGLLHAILAKLGFWANDKNRRKGTFS